MNLQILSQIGLSENEIKVYFALLELGQTTATPIVKRSTVSNSKVYQTLEKLIRKGLVSFVVKDNRKNFQAANPKRLLDLLHKKKADISKQEQEINNILPEIERQRKLQSNKQEATIFEGIKGLKTAFDDILNSLKPRQVYRVFILGDTLKDDKVKRFFNQFHKERMNRKINVKLLAENKHRRTLAYWKRMKGISMKFTNQKLPVGTFIYEDNVMTVTWDGEPTAFVMKSRSNFEHYKAFFDDIWKKAKN